MAHSHANDKDGSGHGVGGHGGDTGTELAKVAPTNEGGDSSGAGKKTKSAEAYMLIFADSIENFIDGIALGIAMGTEGKKAFGTFLAIFLHEVPCQMGVLSILIKGGWTTKGAIFTLGWINFLTFLGGIVGIAATHLNQKSQQYAKLFVAGAFLYIGLTAMLPELKKIHGNKKLNGICTAVIAAGFGLMYLVTFIEGDSHGDHEGHGHRMLDSLF